MCGVSGIGVEGFCGYGGHWMCWKWVWIDVKGLGYVRGTETDLEGLGWIRNIWEENRGSGGR